MFGPSKTSKWGESTEQHVDEKVTEGLNSDCVWVAAVLPRNMASDPDKIWFLVRGQISQSCAGKYGKRTVLAVMRITMYL